MSEDEIRENEKKQEEFGKKTEGEIVDTNKITSIDDILEFSDDFVIIKLKRLKSFGITDEQIKSLYVDKAGNLENERAALETLNVVFTILAERLSDIPNGIIIDLSNGKRNEFKSAKQEQEYGLDDGLEGGLIYSRFDDSNESFVKVISEEDLNEIYVNVKEIYENLTDFKYYNDYSDFDIDEMRETYKEMVKSENVSDKIAETYKKILQDISKYDNKEMEYIDLEIQIAKTKEDSPEREELLDKKEKFLQSNPKDREKYIKISDNLKKNGEINEESFEYKQFRNYENALENAGLLACIASVQELGDKATTKQKLMIALAYNDKKDTYGTRSEKNKMLMDIPEIKEVYDKYEKTGFGKEFSREYRKILYELVNREFKKELNGREVKTLAEFREIRNVINNSFKRNSISNSTFDFEKNTIPENKIDELFQMRSVFLSSNSLYKNEIRETWKLLKEEAWLNDKDVLLSLQKKSFEVGRKVKYDDVEKVQKNNEDYENFCKKHPDVKGASPKEYKKYIVDYMASHTLKKYASERNVDFAELNNEEKKEYLLDTLYGLTMIKEVGLKERLTNAGCMEAVQYVTNERLERMGIELPNIISNELDLENILYEKASAVYFNITGEKYEKKDFLKENGKRRYELTKEKLEKLQQISEEQLRTNSVEDVVNARNDKMNVVIIEDNILKRNEIINKEVLNSNDEKNSLSKDVSVDVQNENVDEVSNDENEDKNKNGFFGNIKEGIKKFMKEKLGINIGKQNLSLPEGNVDIKLNQSNSIENTMDKYKVDIQPVVEEILKDKAEGIQSLKIKIEEKNNEEVGVEL